MLAGQEEWFHPLLNDGRKEGIKNRFVVALTPQATSTTLNAEGELARLSPGPGGTSGLISHQH